MSRSDGGTLVTYDADLALKGPLKLADPLLGLAFNRVGDRALAGLRKTLGTQQPTKLPVLSGRALDGRSYELPADLRKHYSFIVVAFRREQQALVDEWLPWLLEFEERRADVAVYELPVLSSAYGPARRFIDGGMARGVATDPARARTITVYTDVRKVVTTSGSRHRHDRGGARRALRPHPRPRTRQLRRAQSRSTGLCAARGPVSLPDRDMTGRVLVTGATGFIGARLATALASSRWDVRCLVRDRGGSRARALDREGLDLHEGDVLRPETLRGAGQGVDVAYYLIHSMGRGGPKDFAARERAAAAGFARMARARDRRVVYLGGLGDLPQSHAPAQPARDRACAPAARPPADLLPCRNGGRTAE